MAIKVGKLAMNALVIGLLVAILFMLFQGSGKRTSCYSTAPIMTMPGPTASEGPQDLFGLQAGLDCVPGPSENAAYYTVGLNAEGLCGDGDWVTAQMRDYKIETGIGGSLLEK
jgi:hypothetical protein